MAAEPSEQPQHTAADSDALYMLAFDHRQVLRELFPGRDTTELAETKLIAVDALSSMIEPMGGPQSLALLIDEEYGAQAALAARERELTVAMPIEASRTKILQYQYPDDYAERFTKFNPQIVKTLIFDNPADDSERKKTQYALLREMGEFARQQGRKYLVEILMVPTAEQLAASGGTKTGFREKAFPELLIESIAQMQAAGIEPDYWKVEGLISKDATVAVGEQAISGGRDQTKCIVLGSGESDEIVKIWLANAADVPTFSGFAIGRTIWRQPLTDMFAGKLDRDGAVAAIARSFAGFITAFGRVAAKVKLGV